MNQTLCFSAPQALLSAKAGATYISPFLGRLDDIGHVGMDLIRDICEIYRNYGFKTQVLAASIRNPLHVIDAAKAGAHVATMPFSVLEHADEASAHGHRPQEVPRRLGEVGGEDLGSEGALPHSTLGARLRLAPRCIPRSPGARRHGRGARTSP